MKPGKYLRKTVTGVWPNKLHMCDQDWQKGHPHKKSNEWHLLFNKTPLPDSVTYYIVVVTGRQKTFNSLKS